MNANWQDPDPETEAGLRRMLPWAAVLVIVCIAALVFMNT